MGNSEHKDTGSVINSGPMQGILMTIRFYDYYWWLLCYSKIHNIFVNLNVNIQEWKKQEMAWRQWAGDFGQKINTNLKNLIMNLGKVNKNVFPKNLKNALENIKLWTYLWNKIFQLEHVMLM